MKTPSLKKPFGEKFDSLDKRADQWVVQKLKAILKMFGGKGGGK